MARDKRSRLPDPMRTGRTAHEIYRETRRPGSPGLFKRLAATPRLVSAVAHRRYPGLSRTKLFTFVLLVLVYVVSPLDAIPDVIPVLGWTDDSAVVLWFFSRLVRESGSYVDWESDRGAAG